MSGAVAAGKPRQTPTRGSAQPGSCIAPLHMKLQVLEQLEVQTGRKYTFGNETDSRFSHAL